MTRAKIRCAIYTRKSTDDGLEQNFNTLDAQREACTAYIASQSSLGWQLRPHRYDDGGYSGGSMDRPALKELLDDVAQGQIDVVVVYKIDRLTRSLADFARMVEVFETKGTSFVSVTQAFNTTSSMGRLTLNVLLSFAQFEREVTAERIRDKIAASKARGMWMGGTLPLGYDLPEPNTRRLVINPAEAATVREIFHTYLDLGSVHALERHLDARKIRSKSYVTRNGRHMGGKRFSRGALFHLLRNKTYLGLIPHKDKTYDGLHEAIVDQELFDQVQAALNARAVRHRSTRDHVAHAPLAGRIFDADGHPMSPTFSYGKSGRLYRYYVSAPLQQGQVRFGDADTPRRVSATGLEQYLTSVLHSALGDMASQPLDLLLRIALISDTVICHMPIGWLATVQTALPVGGSAVPDPEHADQLILRLPFARKGRTWVMAETPHSKPDKTLVQALRQARKMIDWDRSGHPSVQRSPETPHRRRLIRLAFLAPHIQQAILEGRHPKGLTLARLLAADIPLCWLEQKTRFGF